MPKGGHPKSGPVGLDASQRATRGSRTRNGHRQREAVVVPLGRPAKPDRLGVHGSAEWHRLTRLLTIDNRLCEADRPMLQVACAAFQSVAELRAEREKRDPGSDEWIRLMRAERLELQLYSKALSDLCLTAATRARAPRPPLSGKERGGLATFLRRQPPGA